MADIPATADVIVVGGGVYGASVAYFLAKKNAGWVVLLERKFLASGPTGRSTAQVRRMYPMTFLARTANAGADIFQNWKEIIGGGDPGFQQVGYMNLAAPENADKLRHNAQLAQRAGSKVNIITPDDVKQIVPLMDVSDVGLATFEPESGYADPASTTNAFANRARDLGATIIQYTAVQEILTSGQKVTGVRTDKGEISAPIVINCAGLWANRLLAPLGIKVNIHPQRHQMCFFRRPPEFTGHPATGDSINRTYFRPDHGDLTIFGLSKYVDEVDPDHYNEGADPKEIEDNAERISRRIPIMENGLSRGGYSGLYDETDDGEPILGPIKEYEGLHACFGWSGHGFKHSPVVGEIIADYALTGRSPDYDVHAFRWSRFEEGDPLPLNHGAIAPIGIRDVP